MTISNFWKTFVLKLNSTFLNQVLFIIERFTEPVHQEDDFIYHARWFFLYFSQYFELEIPEKLDFCWKSILIFHSNLLQSKFQRNFYKIRWFGGNLIAIKSHKPYKWFLFIFIPATWLRFNLIFQISKIFKFHTSVEKFQKFFWFSEHQGALNYNLWYQIYFLLLQ